MLHAGRFMGSQSVHDFSRLPVEVSVDRPFRLFYHDIDTTRQWACSPAVYAVILLGSVMAYWCPFSFSVPQASARIPPGLWCLRVHTTRFPATV